MTAKDHNKLVGIFLMVHGGIQAFAIILIGLIYGGIGAAIAVGGKNQEKPIGLIFIAMVAVIAVIGSLFIIPQLVGGWKMLKEKANAKTWGTVASIIAVLSFPLGTAVGVYGMWFLFGEEGKRFYLGEGNQNYINGFNQQNQYQNPPQPPHVWK